MTETALPVRYCHGCRNYDDHPRLLDIGDANNPADDKLYHYDCVPKEVLERQGIPEDHPALVATSQGMRGADIRDIATAHAVALYENDQEV